MAPLALREGLTLTTFFEVWTPAATRWIAATNAGRIYPRALCMKFFVCALDCLFLKSQHMSKVSLAESQHVRHLGDRHSGTHALVLTTSTLERARTWGETPRVARIRVRAAKTIRWQSLWKIRSRALETGTLAPYSSLDAFVFALLPL